MTELERTLLSALEKFEQRQTEQQRALDSVSNALERVSSEYESLSQQVTILQRQLDELKT
ncbi:hypothetical protein HLB35_16255 [Halomonas sp. TBZ9]|uniref:Uncharacterized protein n=1 Tax=Vreelandella azerica TaxID=2732867 RepID=A0A7Y3U080_9GAMM|nr:MbeD/MobD family mobilization/exclusion protein [Halomonas azerica]NOG32935.1 hypothetical protein [Halomonas azerica]